MRPILIPVAAKTDANGAASIDVRLERTGDWRAVKIALGTTGPAEWSAVQSGVPVTFGRGRRVTLGPELMQPDDTLKIEVTGGPVLAQITGSVSGMGGTMQEIVDAFKPAPNTIALDSAIPRQKLFPDGTTVPTSALTPSYTVGASATVTNRFTVPAGTVALRFLVNASGLFFTYELLVTGHQSVAQYYGDPLAPGSTLVVPTPTLPFTIPIENDWDSQVDVTLTNTSTNSLRVFVSALFAPEAPGQTGAAQTVTEISQFWQVEFTTLGSQVGALAAGASATLVAGVATETIVVFGVLVDASGASGGAGFSKVTVRSSSVADSGTAVALRGQDPATQWQTTHAAAPMILGDGLIVKNTDTVAHTITVTVGYSQTVITI